LFILKGESKKDSIMITTGYALLRYSSSTPECEGKFSHIIVVSHDLEKLNQLKNRLTEQNSGSYSDYFEIEEISQEFDEKVLLNLMNDSEK
jgi:hypothetical protein